MSESETWWLVEKWNYGIAEYPVIRETAQTITYVPSASCAPVRVAKWSEYQAWFKTREEAVKHLRGSLERVIAAYSRQLDQAKAKLEALNAEYGGEAE